MVSFMLELQRLHLKQIKLDNANELIQTIVKLSLLLQKVPILKALQCQVLWALGLRLIQSLFKQLNKIENNRL